jgi:hypothetical protein
MLLSVQARADFLRAYLPPESGAAISATLGEPAHILVAGVGNELFSELQKPAVTRALKYRELHPEAPVFLLAHVEGTFEKNSERLSGMGFVEIRRVQKTFSDAAVLSELLAFKRIRTLDFFSHNSPHYGVQLESQYYRFAPDSAGLEKVRTRFTPDAYGFVHGCNGGWIVARTFSKRFGIPFAGSFASTDFEYLNSDGSFYQKLRGQFPSTPFAERNESGLRNPVDCSFGGCARMKPDNSPYNAKWGNLAGGGLNIYKFFCVTVDLATCEKAMARSLLAFPSEIAIDEGSPVEDFRRVAKDFICPSQSKGSFREACSEDLDAFEATGKRIRKTFSGREVQCDFKGCQAKVVCDQDESGAYVHGTCRVENQSPATVTTAQEEYLHYLRGFERIQAE